MIAILLLTALAAPIPPIPATMSQQQATVVAPFRSPRDASQPAKKAMARSVTGTRSYPDTSTIWVRITKDINIFGCNTNDPSCVLYDAEQIEFLQRAGQGAQLELSDDVAAPVWNWVGQFYPPTSDIVNGANFFYPSAQRPAARFYRVVPWEPPITGFRPAGTAPILNLGGFPNLKVWTTPRRR